MQPPPLLLPRYRFEQKLAIFGESLGTQAHKKLSMNQTISDLSLGRRCLYVPSTSFECLFSAVAVVVASSVPSTRKLLPMRWDFTCFEAQQLKWRVFKLKSRSNLVTRLLVRKPWVPKVLPTTGWCLCEVPRAVTFQISWKRSCFTCMTVLPSQNEVREKISACFPSRVKHHS